MLCIKNFLPLVLLFSHNLCPMLPGQTLQPLPSYTSPPPVPAFDQAVYSYNWKKVQKLIKTHDPNRFVWPSEHSPLSYLVSQHGGEEDAGTKSDIWKTISVFIREEKTDFPPDIHLYLEVADPEGEDEPVDLIDCIRKERVQNKRNSLFRILKPLVRDNIEDNCPDDVIKVIVDFTQ